MDDPKFLLLHFFLACMPGEWGYRWEWVKWPLPETDQTAWRAQMWMQKSPLCVCYWSEYICWAFLKKTSELGRPWEATGIWESGWGFGIRLLCIWIQFCHSTSCAVPDKSLYLSEPPFLMFKMALMLYKIVVKIRDNKYEVPNNRKCVAKE